MDIDAFKIQDTHSWTHGAQITSVAANDDGIVSATFERPGDSDDQTGHVLISPMAAPVPPSEDGGLPGRMLWPEAQFEQLRNHRSHWIIASAGPWSPLVRALMVTQVADAILRSHPTALGVVWGPDTLRIYGPAFQEISRLHGPDHLPIMLWIAITITSAGEGLPSMAMTSGMEVFDLMEIECIESPESPTALRERLTFFAEYVIERGASIADGETIGFSAEERLQVVHGPSLVDPDRTVMKIVYPDDFDADRASTAGCLKSSAAVAGLLAIMFLLIGVIVLGVQWATQPNVATTTLRSNRPVDPTPPAMPTPSSVVDRRPTDPSTAASGASQPTANDQILRDARPPKSPYQDVSIETVPHASSDSSPPLATRPAPRTRPSFPTRMQQPRFPRPDVPPPVQPAPDDFTNVGNRALTDVRSAKILARTDRLETPPFSIAFSNSGEFVAVATRGKLTIHDGSTLESLAVGKTDAPFGRLVRTIFTPNDGLVIASNGMGQFRWWRIDVGDPAVNLVRLPNALRSHQRAVSAMTLDPSGKLLVSIDQSGQLIWQRLPDDGQEVPFVELETELEGARGIHLDASSMTVQICGRNESMTVDLRQRQILTSQSLNSNAAALSQDGNRLIVCRGPSVDVVNTATNESIHRFGVSGVPTHVGFLGREHVYALSTTRLDVWSLVSGERTSQSSQTSWPRPIAAMTGDGSRLAITSTVTSEGVWLLSP
ncbi:MAG: DUF4261 domain-containing protein [Planctomycetota bacterium]